MKRLITLSILSTLLVACGQYTPPAPEAAALERNPQRLTAPSTPKRKVVIQYYYASLDTSLINQYPGVGVMGLKTIKNQCRHETQLDAGSVANLSIDYPGCQIFDTADGKVNVGCPNCFQKVFTGSEAAPGYPNTSLPFYECESVKYDASGGTDCTSLVLPYE